MSTMPNNSSSDIFKKGNTISMFIEAGFLGVVPLMLLCFNVLACFQEASLVSQVMPNIEGSYWKALLYTGIALGAGIMFAPNVVWWRQVAKEIKRIKALHSVGGKYEIDYLSNLDSAWWKYLLTWVLCITTSAVAHGLTLMFTTQAFQNQEVLKMLSMKGMEDVSITFCQVVVCSCFFLDILLGVFTNAQIDLDMFLPNQDRDKAMLKNIEIYNKVGKEQAEMHIKLLAEQIEVENEMAKAKNLLNTIKDIKAGKNPTPNSSNNNTNNSDPTANKNNPTPPGNEVPKDRNGKPVYELNEVDQFFGTILGNQGVTENRIKEGIKNANQTKFINEVSPILAKSVNNLKDLYRRKEKEKDINEKVNINGKIEEQVRLALDAFQKIGIVPKKK